MIEMEPFLVIPTFEAVLDAFSCLDGITYLCTLPETQKVDSSTQ